MHIPDHLLQTSVCPVTAAVSAAALSAAVLLAKKSEPKPDPARFASVTALTFAAQMINFPVAQGTSGHLMGGILLVAALGIPWAMLAMSLILALQCFLFADGGATALGANLLNMAVIGTGAAGLLMKRRNIPLPAAAWLSVMLAAGACSLELAWSSRAETFGIFKAMLSTHALIGLGEAGLTALLCAFIRLPAARAAKHAAVFAAAVICATVLAPLASPLPDGLEWTAAHFHLGTAQAPLSAKSLAPYADFSHRQ